MNVKRIAMSIAALATFSATAGPAVPAMAADVHCHFITPGYLALLERHGASMDELYPLPEWSPEALAAFLDKAGIGLAVLTSVAPQPHFGDAIESVRRLLAITTPDRILYGSDFPYAPAPALAAGLAKLRADLAADHELAPHADAILSGNAKQLFGMEESR